MTESSAQNQTSSAMTTLESPGTLTWRQKQLLASGQIARVFNEQSRRHRFISLQSMVSAGLLCLMICFWSWPSMSLVYFAFIIPGELVIQYSRITGWRSAVRTVRDNAASVVQCAAQISQADHLKQAYSLLYNQHQKLKLGQVVEVARELAASCRFRGLLINSVTGLMFIAFAWLSIAGRSSRTLIESLGDLVMCLLILNVGSTWSVDYYFRLADLRQMTEAESSVIGMTSASPVGV